MADRRLYVKEITLVVVLLAALAFSVSYQDFVSTGKVISSSELSSWAGAPWNVFTNEPAIIVMPDPVQIDSSRTSVIIEAKGEYLRKDFYFFNRNTGNWDLYSFDIGNGGEVAANAIWLKGSGRKELLIDSSLLAEKNYIAAATCHRNTAGELKCGCLDANTCQRWQLQGFSVSSIVGDFDGDNKVAFSDYVKLAATYGKARGDQGYNENADIFKEMGSKDIINFQDYVKFMSVFGVDLTSRSGTTPVPTQALGEILTPRSATCHQYDYNGDGIIVADDVGVFSDVLADNSRASSYPGKKFDMNNDGKVDFSDFVSWAANPACASTSSGGSGGGGQTTYECFGAYIPYAQICSGDDTGLTADTQTTLVSACGTTKCEYTCNSGFTKHGNSCVAVSGTSTIPSAASFTECRGGRYDFNGDGKVDTSDVRPDNCNNLNCAHAFREGVTGQKCPSNLYCAGRFVTEAEYAALPAFVSKCVEFDKTVKTVCDDPQHDLNNDGILDIRDVKQLYDVSKQTSPQCLSGKLCDLDNDGVIGFGDVKAIVQLSTPASYNEEFTYMMYNGEVERTVVTPSKCRGISTIDYNSDGSLNLADIKTLSGLYSSVPVDLTKVELLRLKTICFSTLFDFVGTVSGSMLQPPDGKLTDGDISTLGGAVTTKNGANSQAVTQLRENSRQCPPGTFCAGRIPNEQDFYLLGSMNTECKTLYSKHPTVTGASSFTSAFEIEKGLDSNGDGNADEVDFSMISKLCAAGKRCDFDASGVGASDVDIWLSLVALAQIFR